MENGMTSSTHPEDLLGAYATGACTPEESTLVAAHAAGCAPCTAEIGTLTDAARWIGTTHADAPLPQGLRSRVLAAAFRTRPAREPATAAHLDPYVLQVTAFGRLLAELDEPQWLLPTGPHATVREMVRHLTANDGLVAADLGLAAESRGWQAQADGLLRTVSGADTRILARPVRLAGGVRAPLRDALTQRAFETWIHADDIRSALRMPVEVPPPEHVARIVAFGLRLLPAAMDAAGRAHPDRCARLVLTGPGGGEHVVALSEARRPDAGAPESAEIVLPAVRFCRLMAGRTLFATPDVRIAGDVSMAADVLAVAATLGCD
jgi:uncharacterized protein (TIGR03083 family)